MIRSLVIEHWNKIFALNIGFRCEWRILAEPNHGVNIRFAQFDLEREANCEFDYVEIYDGSEILEEHRVARYCGDKVIHFMISW